MDPQPLFIDLATGACSRSNVQSLPPQISGILGAALNLRVAFCEHGVPQEVAVAASGVLVIKAAGDYGGAVLLSDNAWAATGADETARYTFSMPLTTDALKAKMGALEQLQLIGQIEIMLDGEDSPRRSKPFPLTVLNSPIAPGDAEAPAPTGPLALPFYAAINTLTGGGANALDGLATVGRSVPWLVTIYNGGLQGWRLEAGTDAEDGENVIRPDDYASGTNEKVWKIAL